MQSASRPSVPCPCDSGHSQSHRMRKCKASLSFAAMTSGINSRKTSAWGQCTKTAFWSVSALNVEALASNTPHEREFVWSFTFGADFSGVRSKGKCCRRVLNRVFSTSHPSQRYVWSDYQFKLFQTSETRFFHRCHVIILDFRDCCLLPFCHPQVLDNYHISCLCPADIYKWLILQCIFC